MEGGREPQGPGHGSGAAGTSHPRCPLGTHTSTHVGLCVLILLENWAQIPPLRSLAKPPGIVTEPLSFF